MENEEKGTKKKVTVKKVKAKKVEVVEPLTKKQELNNHIVSMRKAVRKGRVHVINKLTKEIKRLKERKGAEQAKEKAKRKAEKLVQEIHIIKHLKEDKVSIYALRDKKKLHETLADIQSTIEERALARLGHTPAVQHEIRKYRESNPYWDLQLPVLLERSKDKRRRINKKLLEREALKGVKKGPVKSEASDEEDQEQSSDEEQEGASVQSDASDSEPEPEDKELETSLEEEDTPLAAVKETTEKVVKTKAVKVEAKKAILKKAVVNKAAKVLKLTKPEKKKNTAPKIEKSQGSIRVQVLNNLSDLEQGESLKVKLTADNIDEIPNKRPKSSFFVGGEDDKTKIPEEPRPQPDKPRKERRALLHSSAEFKPIFRKGKLVNGPQTKRFKTEQPKRNSNNSYFKGDEGSSNLTPLGNKPASKSEGPKASKSSLISAPSAGSEKLHPSWEAKKRQQTSLAAFKGKKTTFDD